MKQYSSLLVSLPALLLAGVAMAQPVLLAQRNAPWSVAAVADFDGDGDADILWRDPSSGENLIDLIDTAVVVASDLVNVDSDDSWQILDAADFSGDGRADILRRNRTTGHTRIDFMDGTTIIDHQQLSGLGSPWRLAGAGDCDGDGLADLVWRHHGAQAANSGAIRIQLMRYGAYYGLEVDREVTIKPAADLSWRIAGIDDFDGDDDDDLLWWNESGSTWVSLLDSDLHAGVVIDQEGGMANAEPGWRLVGTGDVFADGRAGIVWWNDGSKHWHFRQQGVQTAQQQRVPKMFEDPKFVFEGVGDFDADGNGEPLWRDPASGETWTSVSRLPIRSAGLKPTSTVGAVNRSFLAGPLTRRQP